MHGSVNCQNIYEQTVVTCIICNVSGGQYVDIIWHTAPVVLCLFAIFCNCHTVNSFVAGSNIRNFEDIYFSFLYLKRQFSWHIRMLLCHKALRLYLIICILVRLREHAIIGSWNKPVLSIESFVLNETAG